MKGERKILVLLPGNKHKCYTTAKNQFFTPKCSKIIQLKESYSKTSAKYNQTHFQSIIPISPKHNFFLSLLQKKKTHTLRATYSSESHNSDISPILI